MDILHYVVGDNIVIATTVIFTDQYRNVIMGLCGKIDIYQVIFPSVFFQKGAYCTAKELVLWAKTFVKD